LSGARPSRRAVLTAAGAGGAAAAAGLGASAVYRTVSAGGHDRPPAEDSITWAASPIDQNASDSRQMLIDAYLEAEPTARVRLLPGPSSTDSSHDALSAAIGAGSDIPDVFLGDIIWPAEFGAKRLARPLDDVFPSGFWNHFDPSLTPTASYRGRMYAAPFYANHGVLFYRKDLLRRAGLGVPATWEDLAASATVLRSRGLVAEGFIFQGAPYEGLTCVWTEFVADAGGETVDPGTTTARVASAAALRALTFMRTLVTEQVTPADVVAVEEPQAVQRFNAGRVAFMRGWNAGDTRVVTDPDVVGVTQLPTFAGRPAGGYSTIGGWSLFMNANTNRIAPAREFIDWLTGVPAQRILGRLAQIPTNRTVHSDPTIMHSNPVLTITQNVRPVARPANTPRYADLSRAVYTNINQALRGAASPAAALRAAQRALEEILRDG
jgi:multiple sugar transport system substrate-binding protein